MKNLLIAASFAGLLSFASLGWSQAMPTATARGNLQIGGGVTLASPDYAQQNIKGISGFADFELSPHLGLEADIHYVAIVTPTDLAENTYEIGPRYVYHKGHFNPYAKALVGRGDLVIQLSSDNPGRYSGSYFMYSIGAGLDFDLFHHLTIRAIDAEYQRWPGLGNGLSPTVFTVGAAYRFR